MNGTIFGRMQAACKSFWIRTVGPDWNQSVVVSVVYLSTNPGVHSIHSTNPFIGSLTTRNQKKKQKKQKEEEEEKEEAEEEEEEKRNIKRFPLVYLFA